MRILHVTDTYAPTVGGIEALVETMSAVQAERGHRITVLTRTPGERRPTKTDVARVEVLRDPNLLTQLVSDADVVHAHVSAYSPLALKAAVLAATNGVPALASVHSVWGRGWPIMSSLAWGMGALGLPIQWAAVSGVAADYVDRAMRPFSPVLVVPNAIDTRSWAPLPAPERGAGDPVTFVSTLRMTSRKRGLPLLKMLRQVRHQVPDDVRLRAILVGDGPQAPLLRRYAALHRMDWVEFPGVLGRDQIREVYARADVYAAPAIMESFGLAALEARTSGLPVVAMRRSGVSTLLKNGVDAFLVDDDKSMTSALTTLAVDASLRRSMATQCRQARPGTDWGTAMAMTFAAYSNAAELLAQPIALPVNTTAVR